MRGYVLLFLWVAVGVLISGCAEESPPPAPLPPVSSSAGGWLKEAGPVYGNDPRPEYSLTADPGALYHNGTWYLYYPTLRYALVPEADPGIGPCEFQPGPRCAWLMEFATSADGLTWKKFDRGTTDPRDDYVLLPDSKEAWDRSSVETPTLLHEDGKYRMWYAGGGNIGAQEYAIGYAESTDGIHWEKHDDPATTGPLYGRSDPVLPPRPGQWDSYMTADPTVIKDGALYRMWYAAVRPGRGDVAIGYAESEDGIRWRRLDKPVLEPTEPWEGKHVGGPSVLKTDKGYEMWYYPGSAGIAYATSPDGTTWTRKGVALIPGGPGAWDEAETSSPTVLHRNGTYWLYYTGTRCPLEQEKAKPDCPKPPTPPLNIRLGLARLRP